MVIVNIVVMNPAIATRLRELDQWIDRTKTTLAKICKARIQMLQLYKGQSTY